MTVRICQTLIFVLLVLLDFQNLKKEYNIFVTVGLAEHKELENDKQGFFSGKVSTQFQESLFLQHRRDK